MALRVGDAAQRKRRAVVGADRRRPRAAGRPPRARRAGPARDDSARVLRFFRFRPRPVCAAAKAIARAPRPSDRPSSPRAARSHGLASTRGGGARSTARRPLERVEARRGRRRAQAPKYAGAGSLRLRRRPYATLTVAAAGAASIDGERCLPSSSRFGILALLLARVEERLPLVEDAAVCPRRLGALFCAASAMASGDASALLDLRRARGFAAGFVRWLRRCAARPRGLAAAAAVSQRTCVAPARATLLARARDALFRQGWTRHPRRDHRYAISRVGVRQTTARALLDDQ